MAYFEKKAAGNRCLIVSWIPRIKGSVNNLTKTFALMYDVGFNVLIILKFEFDQNRNILQEP